MRQSEMTDAEFMAAHGVADVPLDAARVVTDIDRARYLAASEVLVRDDIARLRREWGDDEDFRDVVAAYRDTLVRRSIQIWQDDVRNMIDRVVRNHFN